ncbi:MAG: tRNA (5-methylaminomethyl-2-thiouridine)(34)-methyltransferase MnmD [Proteobacteria bacterium]|nr:tRNA (5-methylaminomethyl-2-thiouridine)(34)-methyltransferase MnmD [Pseudomonadota bacterium]
MTHTYAKLDWTDDGQPLSKSHGDVYFSRASGLDETRHVFLTGNSLPARWQNAPAFTIAETGFGTGLNFLAAWQLWQQTASPEQRLNFISVEKFPLTPEDMAKALALWPELGTWTRPLLEAYPALLAGMPMVHNNVTLRVDFTDTASALPSWTSPVDAWFLDGFAPAKNPDMWTNDLFTNMARLTPCGGTFATFTAAGVVRRGLQNAGFDVHKVRGFGHKRDMLTGQRT